MNCEVMRFSYLKSASLIACMTLCACSKERRVVGGTSMEPSFKDGEVISVSTKAYSGATPQRWDVVVFKNSKNEELVFRIVGLPGEAVDLTTAGLHIDGKPFSLDVGSLKINYEPLPKKPILSQVSYPLTLSENCYFVLGDNTKNSFDSRFFGEIPRKQIIGKVQ